MGRVPDYYRRNAAQGVAKRVLKGGGNEKPCDMREVVTLCYLIALRNVTEWNTKQVDEYLKALTRNRKDYAIREQTAGGKHKACRWLHEMTQDFNFVLPAGEGRQSAKSRDELAQKRMSVDITWRLLCLALVRQRPWGCEVDKKTAQKVLDESTSAYRWFLYWEKQGGAYAMERMKQQVENVLGEAVDAANVGGGTAFGDRIY